MRRHVQRRVMLEPAFERELSGNCADRVFAGIALLAIARGNQRRESVLSNQHRLLGEDTRHRALR